MSFAKLSGSLLDCQEAPRHVPAVTPPPRRAHGAPAPSAAPSPPPSAAEAELLIDYLKALRLPTFLAAYEKLALQCSADGVTHSGYLLRLAELELTERHRRKVDRLIKAAHFPAVKSVDTFDFAAIPSLDKKRVLELAECEYVARRENVIILGDSGTGKTHIAIGLGLAACRNGLSVGFVTASALMHELLETRVEWSMLRLQRRLDTYKLLIIDELGYVPLSTAEAELLFEVISQRCERGSTIITSNLPITDWVSVFGTERLTGALLDRLSYRLHILEMNGESYRVRHRELHQPHPHTDGAERKAPVATVFRAN
jgi:DNA replication protein DnaC